MNQPFYFKGKDDFDNEENENIMFQIHVICSFLQNNDQ